MKKSGRFSAFARFRGAGTSFFGPRPPRTVAHKTTKRVAAGVNILHYFMPHRLRARCASVRTVNSLRRTLRLVAVRKQACSSAKKPPVYFSSVLCSERVDMSHGAVGSALRTPDRGTHGVVGLPTCRAMAKTSALTSTARSQ